MSSYWIAIVQSKPEKHLLLNLENLSLSSVLGDLRWFFYCFNISGCDRVLNQYQKLFLVEEIYWQIIAKFYQT